MPDLTPATDCPYWDSTPTERDLRRPHPNPHPDRVVIKTAATYQPLQHATQAPHITSLDPDNPEADTVLAPFCRRGSHRFPPQSALGSKYRARISRRAPPASWPMFKPAASKARDDSRTHVPLQPLRGPSVYLRSPRVQTLLSLCYKASRLRDGRVGPIQLTFHQESPWCTRLRDGLEPKVAGGLTISHCQP